MKKLISKLKKIKDNAGSGIILVIVALGFIGILTGALLTAVGYVYRLKLYDYNARDNFYYVEQAMNEIYAGIGNKTVGCMQTAYNYTVDNMTYYDINAGSNGAYVTKTNDEANKDFKKKFMAEVYNVFYSAGSNEFVSSLAACITNDSVKLEDYEWATGTNLSGDSFQYLTKKANRSGITVLMYDKDGNILTGATIDDQMKLDKIVIKNIVLSRTAEYNRSQANGTFTQTLSADIVIAKPDFEVNFNSINADFNTLLDYSIIADMGIDINQYSKLNIAGNIYAGADYYNKWYNYYGTAYTDPTQANADRYYAYDYTIDNNGTEIMTAGTLINNTNDDRYKQSLSPSPKLTFGTDVNNTFSWQSVERHQKYKVDGNGNILVDENGNQLTEDDDAYTARYFMLPVTNKTFGTLDINADYTNRRQAVETGAGGYTYFNRYLYNPGSSTGSKVATMQEAKFDGINEHSKYSGLYINGTEVDLVSNMVIVPGTIAVMNSGSLSMYGIESNKIVNSEVWADNVVLGGYSLINPANREEVTGSSAVFNADLYVRDDLQLDADNSKFVINGSYYGYGDSTKRDNRRFIPTVDPENFYKATYKTDSYGNYIWYDVDHMRVYEYDGDEEYVDSVGNTVKKGDLVDISASLVSQGKTTSKEGRRVDKAFREQIDEYVLTADDFGQDDYYYEDQYSLSPDTRGHYNSSAIVINGENANLDLSKADTIYVAGRAYVELSKYTDITSTPFTKYEDSSKSSGITYNVDVKSYTYDAAIDDYRTGDSISVKPSQQAYMPPAYVSAEHTVYYLDAGTDDERRHDYYAAELAYNITYDDSVFSDYFGYDEVNDKIIAPCYKYDTFGKSYLYYDFEVAYDMMKNKTDGVIYRNNNDTDPNNNINNADDMAQQFIVDYDYACKNDARLVPHLTKIDDQSESTSFEVGQISLPANATGDHVYSSGAISAKNNTNFTITTAKNAQTSELNELLDRTTGQSSLVTNQAAALRLSDDLLKKSQYVKFSLANISKNSAKAAFVDYLIGYHSEADTIANGDTNERILGIKGEDIDNSHSHAGSYSHGGIRGESSITPINTYLNFFKINNSKLIVPKGLKSKYEGSVPEGTTIQEIELGSNNDIYVTSQDITIYPKSDDGKVKGIIIAKGDVTFDSTVTSFEGLIVSGSKVYITEKNNITTIKSNPEAVKAILNELQLVEGAGVREEVTYLTNSLGQYIDYEGNVLPDGEAPVIAYQTDGHGGFVTDENGQRVPITNSVNVGDAEQKALADEVLDLFKAYEDSSTEALASDDRSVNVYDLDYTSVMKYDNWVKNVE